MSRLFSAGLALLVASLLSLTARATPPPSGAADAARVAHLLDYIGSDYPGAVQDGQVVDAREYDEQLALAGDAAKLLGELVDPSGSPGDRALVETVKQVRALVAARAPGSDVARASATARAAIAARFELKESPDAPPDEARGRALYAERCASCHGASGHADTDAAKALEPRPTDFHARSISGKMSPYRVFTTTEYGVPNTAMAPFPELTDAERWDLAFWVASLDHERPATPEPGARFITLAELSMRSDDELRAELAAAGLAGADVERSLAELRTRAPFEPEREGSTLSLARAALLRVAPLYRRGDATGARRRLLDAYLDGVEPIEAALRARDAGLTRALEGSFQDARAAIERRASPDEVEARVNDMLAQVGRAERLLGNDSAGQSFWSVLLAAAGIALREGVEAALIIAALLAVVAKSERPERKRVVHLGWMVALAAGLLTWFASSYLTRISGARRELMEGVTALLAAAVLFYVSYWLLAQREVARWMSFLREKASGGRATFTLFGVAFLAVYREAFETVLFFQAIVSQPGSGPAALAGIAVGLIALAVIVLVYGRAGKLAPPRAFFTFSSLLLYALAIVFIGEGVSALQTTGTFPLHPARLPALPALGVYPTLETYAAQGVLVAAAAAAWVRLRARERGESAKGG